MKEVLKYMGIVLLCMALPYQINAVNLNADTVLLKSENRFVHAQLYEEIARLQSFHPEVRPEEFQRFKNLELFLECKNYPRAKKINYLRRLIAYISLLENASKKAWFQNGRVSDALQFYPVALDADQTGMLQMALQSNESYFMKTYALLKGIPAADSFLFEYASRYPDDALKYYEFWADQDFSLTLLKRISSSAPLSVNKYFQVMGGIRERVFETNDSVFNALERIYKMQNSKPADYLMLQYYASNQPIPVPLEDLQTNKTLYFKILADLHFSERALAKYSIDQKLKELSIEVMREINYYYSNGYKNNVKSILSSFTDNEILLIFLYGHGDATQFSFSSYIELIKYRKPSPFGLAVIQNINKEELSSFLKVAEKSNLLDEILTLFDASCKTFLLSSITESDSRIVNYADYVDEFLKSYIPANASESFTTKDLQPATTINISQPATLNPAIVPSKVTTIDPIEPFRVDLSISAKEKMMFQILKNVDQGLSRSANFIDKTFAKELLMELADLKPDDVFRNIKNIQSKYWIKSVLETAANKAPASFKRYLPNVYHPVNLILQYSQDSVVKEMFSIYDQMGYRTNAYLLIDELERKKMSLAEADRIAQDQELLFKELLSVRIREEAPLGSYSIDKELEQQVLQFIRKMNDINSMDDNIRFEAVNGMSSEQLYMLMIYGEDELFRISFSGLYKRMRERMKTDTYSFLEKMHFFQCRRFIKICSTFDKLDDFLAGMNPDQRKKLLTQFVSNLELHEFNADEIVQVPDALSGIKSVSDRILISQIIKSEFERLEKSKKAAGLMIYGLLATMLHNDPIPDKKWFDRVASGFQLPILDQILVQDLFNAKNECIQQHFFYNDEDGRSSFQNFLYSFKSSPYWSFEDKNTFVKIRSNSGSTVIIYANKPEFEVNGVQDIQAEMTDKSISPKVIVHRGHSFHTEKTLSVIPGDTKVIIVGSCGGYYKLPIALERAPASHAIATRQIGTMRVNDPIIKVFCEKVRQGKNIIWSDFWSEIETACGKNSMFYDYIPPHKNLGSLFLQAYFESIENAQLKP